MSSAPPSEVVVLDTNVVSYIFKRDTRGELYKPHVEGKLQMIAAQTFAEIERLPLENNWGVKRHTELRERLGKFIFVEANKEIALFWAKIQAHAKRIGRPITVGDTWIAATALAYDAPLVTHNRKDFAHVPGLTVLSEN
ncbi:MAG: PIN domain-containing protein [Rubrivivax sp.]|nr:PIN domain-containing protein [Pyrinomonadaceae bacterium]